MHKIMRKNLEYLKSILCLRQCHAQLKDSNCFMHDKMVDFPKFVHICIITSLKAVIPLKVIIKQYNIST